MPASTNKTKSQTVLFHKAENVARITLNRPEVYNSFNREMILGLQACLDEAALDQEVRVVVLAGAGKAFCAGQDLGEFLEEDGQLPSDRDLAFDRIVDEHYTPLILKITGMNKPVVAAVNGVAAGAGANLALACDLVVAVEEASFIQAFSKIGLVPDSGGTYFLPRLVGRQRATALMLLGEKVSAAEAKQIGMIYDWYSAADFENKVKELAKRLSDLPTKALGYTKQLLQLSVNNTLEAQLKAEGMFQQKAGQSADFAEGVRAFLEKRRPEFNK